MFDQIDQSNQDLINTFLEPTTSSRVIESNKIKEMVCMLICQSFQISGLYVMVETLYTFGSSLNYTVTLTKSLPFNIWVSSQVQGSTQSTISINGTNLIVFNCDNQLLTKTNKITINLDMLVQIKIRPNDIIIMKGPSLLNHHSTKQL